MKISFIKIFIFIFFLGIGLPAFSQGFGSLEFVNSLGDKKQVTYGEAVDFFIYILGGYPTNFQANIQYLNKAGITQDIIYQANNPLRRGTISLMLVRHLKLTDSLFYRMFKTQRYAFRVCIAKGIMDADGSERDILSGEELIEIMSRALEKKAE
jgi:hypothetical protein